MLYTQSANMYGEGDSRYEIENVQINNTPESQWLITESGDYLITETSYTTQERVESTNFLVVKDLP